MADLTRLIAWLRDRLAEDRTDRDFEIEFGGKNDPRHRADIVDYERRISKNERLLAECERHMHEGTQAKKVLNA